MELSNRSRVFRRQEIKWRINVAAYMRAVVGCAPGRRAPHNDQDVTVYNALFVSLRRLDLI